METEMNLRCRDKLVVAQGEGLGEGMEWEVEVSRCKAVYGMDKQQCPTICFGRLCSTYFDKP